MVYLPVERVDLFSIFNYLFHCNGIRVAPEYIRIQLVALWKLKLWAFGLRNDAVMSTALKMILCVFATVGIYEHGRFAICAKVASFTCGRVHPVTLHYAATHRRVDKLT